MNPAARALPTPDDVDHPIGLGRKPEGLEGWRKNQVALSKRYGLESSSHVLEIGCGVGWLAYDLAAILGPDGSYAGFDVSPYLREIVRTLQPGRPALVNFMAITPLDENPRHGTREYVESAPGVYTNRPDCEGWSLAFDDSLIRSMIDAAGLDIVTAEEGAWHGRRSSADGAVRDADLYVVTPRT